jgi:hypothetical protein
MIEGGLDLSGLDLKKDEEGKHVVASQIRIRNSIIQGIVKFDNAIFERVVDFEGTTLMLAGFRYAKFCKYAGFEDTTSADMPPSNMFNSWARRIPRMLSFPTELMLIFTKRNSEIMFSSGV